MSGEFAEQIEYDRRQPLRQRRLASDKGKAAVLSPPSSGKIWGVPEREVNGARSKAPSHNGSALNTGNRRPSLHLLKRPGDGTNGPLCSRRSKDEDHEELESPLNKIDSLGTMQTGLVRGQARSAASSSSGGLHASTSGSLSNSRRGSGGSRRGSRLALGVTSGYLSSLTAIHEGSKMPDARLVMAKVRYTSLGDQIIGELFLYMWAIIFSRMLAVLPSIASWAAGSESEEEIEREARRLFDEGRYELSLTKHLALLKVIERQYGRDSIPMARARHSTGGVYAKLEKWDAAVAQFTRSMLLFEILEGEESEGVTDVQVSLGVALQKEGKLGRALAELEQARDAFVLFHLREGDEEEEEEEEEENGRGGGSILEGMHRHSRAGGGRKKESRILRFARAVNEIGIICFKLGDVGRAKVELEEALRVFESAGASGRVEVAHTKCQLGRVLLNLGEMDCAEEHCASAIKIYEQLGLGNTQSAGGLHSDLGLVQWNQSRYGEACLSFERAIAILEDVLGEDHVKVANARAERGTMLVRLGRYGEAVGECHAAIHICSKRLGRKHAMVAHLKGQLGLALLHGGDPDKAMEAFEEGRALFSARFGEDSHQATTILPHIGSALSRLGRHPEAAEQYRKAAAAMERRGSGGVMLADVLNQCGISCWMCGHFDEALEHYTEALGIYVSGLGNGSEQAASTRYNIGVVYQKLGKYEKARGYYKLVLETYHRMPGGKYDSNIADLHNRIGVSYSSQGMDDKAQEEFLRALEYFTSCGGKDPSHAFTLRELGALCMRAGRHEEALGHYTSSLGLLEGQGGDRMAAANLENEMGLLHWRKGCNEEALCHYQKALVVYVELGGADSSEVACCRNNIGAVYQKQGHLDKALAEYTAALSIYRAKLGHDHALSASTVNNIAMVYQRQGQLDKAVSQYQVALAMYEKRGVQGAVDAAGTRVNIAKVRQEQGQHSVAADMFGVCVGVFRRAYGKRHPTVASVTVHLAECLDALGQVDDAQHLFRDAASTYKAIHGKASSAYQSVRSKIHTRSESESPMLNRRGGPPDDVLSPETPSRKHRSRLGGRDREMRRRREDEVGGAGGQGEEGESGGNQREGAS